MEAPPHIVKAFDFEIKGLNNKIAAMGKGCEWQLAKAVNSLTNLDFRLAQEVIKEDSALNDLYKKLEADAVGLLAKRQPLARDLRYLLAIMRTGSELERIGDYAANIAKRVLELTDTRLEDPINQIGDMSKICRGMVNDAVQAFLTQDVKRGLEVWHRDDVVDRKFARMMTWLRNRMKEDPDSIENCTQLIFMGRCLERIGDHVTNISEDIYYIETGESFIGAFDDTIEPLGEPPG